MFMSLLSNRDLLWQIAGATQFVNNDVKKEGIGHDSRSIYRR